MEQWLRNVPVPKRITAECLEAQRAMPSASLAVKAGTRSRGTRLFRLLRPPHYWPNYPANSRYEGLLAGSKPESMRCLFALSLLLTAGVGTRNMMRCLRNLLRRPAERKRLPTISPFQVLKLHASVGAAAHGIKSSNMLLSEMVPQVKQEVASIAKSVHPACNPQFREAAAKLPRSWVRTRSRER